MRQMDAALRNLCAVHDKGPEYSSINITVQSHAGVDS